tara:strand:+ start:858 stop:1226 length:369 start_codon:yes stop_codon:yes gene_type:complete
MAEYAERDQKIHQLRCELNHRKELLAGKLGKLSEASKVNSMLEGVVEDYKNHTQQVVEEKNRQDKALRDILEHLNKVMEEEGLTDKGLEHIRQQQKEILDELDSVKKNLDSILSKYHTSKDV